MRPSFDIYAAAFMHFAVFFHRTIPHHEDDDDGDATANTYTQFALTDVVDRI